MNKLSNSQKIIDAALEKFSEHHVISLSLMAEQLYWSMASSVDPSHIVIFDKGDFSFTTIVKKVEAILANRPLTLSNSYFEEWAIREVIESIFRDETLNNWAFVHERNLVMIEMRYSPKHPFSAVLTSGKRIDYLSLHRVAVSNIAYNTLDNDKNISYMKARILKYTVDRAKSALTSGIKKAASMPSNLEFAR